MWFSSCPRCRLFRSLLESELRGVNNVLSTACVRQLSYLSRPASKLSFQTQPSPPTPAATMSAETASGPTQDQVEILEYNFNKVNRHPDPTTLLLIAAEAGLSEEETQKWFKQRLAQWRKSEGLPSESRSVTD